MLILYRRASCTSLGEQKVCLSYCAPNSPTVPSPTHPLPLELIITAGGENIGPVPIESALKKELPIVSHIVLIGDQRKFLSCLLTLKVSNAQTDGRTDGRTDRQTDNVLFHIGGC